MTIPVQTIFNQYTANGVTTVFPYGFKITDAADMQVSVGGVVVTTGFTVDGVGVTGGGNITFAIAPLNTLIVLIELYPLFKRVTDYPQFGDFPAPIVNNDFDRLVLMVQRIAQDIKLAFRLPIGASASTDLPEPLANKVIGWNSAGDKMVNYEIPAWSSLDNLAATTGASNLGANDANSGTLFTTVQGYINYFRNILRNVRDSGVVGDGVTNDSAAVETAVLATPQSKELYVPTDTNIGTARVANVDGVQFVGPGKLTYVPTAVSGYRVQNPSGRNGNMWGSEYLYEFLVKLAAGTAVTIRMTGDSTTAQSQSYSYQLQSILASVPGVTVTIAGYSGKSTADWVSTYLAADIAAANDVLIWHWGMNDVVPGLGTDATTMAQFEANLRNGLATYRASVPIGTGGIILMTPNATSDGANGRDELRAEKFRNIIKNAAEDFQCAYFDTYAFYQDAYVGIGTWLDNTWGDGLRGVHPQTAFSQCIAGELLALLIPKGMQSIIGGGGVSNAAGTSITIAVTDPMSSYPAGFSIRRAQVAAPYNWPVDGWTITIRENYTLTSCLQFLYKYSADSIPQFRVWTIAGGGSWGVWCNLDIVNDATFVTAAAASNTFPLGLSIHRTQLSDGWPNAGRVQTVLERANGLYATQINYAYQIDVPALFRTWNVNAGGWGTWRSIGSMCIADSLKYIGNGSTSVTAHTIGHGIAYTRILDNTAAAAYTLTLPTPNDGDKLTINFVNATGAITYNVTAPATSTAGLPATLAANTPLTMIYHAATTSWYPA